MFRSLALGTFLPARMLFATFCGPENPSPPQNPQSQVDVEVLHRDPQRETTLRTKSQRLAHIDRAADFLEVPVYRRRGLVHAVPDLLLNSLADEELQRAAAPQR